MTETYKIQHGFNMLIQGRNSIFRREVVELPTAVGSNPKSPIQSQRFMRISTGEAEFEKVVGSKLSYSINSVPGTWLSTGCPTSYWIVLKL